MESDIRNLTRHGLAEQRTIEGQFLFEESPDSDQGWPSAAGTCQLVSDRQAMYHGFVKPKEVRHDADLYRLYQQVAKEDRSGRAARFAASSSTTS